MFNIIYITTKAIYKNLKISETGDEIILTLVVQLNKIFLL